jgi:hypothetical protein
LRAEEKRKAELRAEEERAVELWAAEEQMAELLIAHVRTAALHVEKSSRMQQVVEWQDQRESGSIYPS